MHDRALRILRLVALLSLVAGLVALGATGCSRAPESEVVRGDIGEALNEHMSVLVPYGFSGALLVAEDGEPVLQKGYGLADESRGIANSTSTVFSTCSLTKQFTAAAILKLEMEGRLSTEDTLGEFIDDVPEDKRPITIHQLLTHTSGLIGSTGHDFNPIERDKFISRALVAPLLFEPGTGMSYSNAGYSLLAAIVEIRSGVGYEEYLRTYLFEPAGMRKTGYTIPEWDEGSLARWYEGETDNGTLLDKDYPYWNLIGNGGIMSTLGDMFLWYQALKGEEVLSAQAKEKLWTPVMHDYAYGWNVAETPRGKVIQHDGASRLGASAEFRWFVDRDLLIVLFCNRSYVDVPMFELVREEIEDLAFGGEIEAPPPAVHVDEETLDRLAGKYRLRSGGGAGVTREGDMLRIATFDQDMINGLFQPRAEPDTYSDLNAKAGRLIAAAVSGNHDVFQEELGDEDVALRVEQLLTSSLRSFAERTGSPLAASVLLGTVPMHDGRMAITGMRIRTTDGDKHDMSFWWQEGRLFGLDERGFPVSIPLAPVSENVFVGYHLAFAKPNTVSFEMDDDGAVTAMMLGPRTAWRIAGTVQHTHDHDEGGHAGEVEAGHRHEHGGQPPSGQRHGHAAPGESGEAEPGESDGD